MRLNHFVLKSAGKNKGFALIAAVFLIVVVSLAVTYMQRLSSNQSNTSALSAQNARALQAAQASLEWTIYKVWTQLTAGQSVSGICTGSAILAPNTPINGMTVRATCTPTNYTEAGQTITLYSIDATAEQPGGNLNSPDYVFKHVQATIEVGS